ncbi:SDR family NAD(P)-dependent oxidoreductase [Streptomyces capparidis]
MPTEHPPGTAPAGLPAAYDLSGRTALVTGAGSGIGRASAMLLARAGAAVACADIDAAGAEETARRIGADGGTATAHPVDVADRAQVASAVAALLAAHGRLDVMANIAGIMHASPVLATADADLERVLAVNFRGVLHGCQEAGRAMAARGGGSIVNMASGAVDSATPGLLCYSVSKVAVVQLTRTLAAELGPAGVRVNAVAPGWVPTAMTGRHDGEGAAPSFGDRARRLSPLSRVGTPEDVAHAVLYLACDASSFTTGQILRPNGGVAMPW